MKRKLRHVSLHSILLLFYSLHTAIARNLVQFSRAVNWTIDHDSTILAMVLTQHNIDIHNLILTIEHKIYIKQRTNRSSTSFKACERKLSQSKIYNDSVVFTHKLNKYFPLGVIFEIITVIFFDQSAWQHRCNRFVSVKRPLIWNGFGSIQKKVVICWTQSQIREQCLNQDEYRLNFSLKFCFMVFFFIAILFSKPSIPWTFFI